MRNSMSLFKDIKRRSTITNKLWSLKKDRDSSFSISSDPEINLLKRSTIDSSDIENLHPDQKLEVFFYSQFFV